ncbi:MAG: hypothetical protein KME16_27500 [Scytolyngbya sp. HA4215-MV1]|nr:hypothetical protein [Scytolyngbya sp. HA4215-MV1]
MLQAQTKDSNQIDIDELIASLPTPTPGIPLKTLGWFAGFTGALRNPKYSKIQEYRDGYIEGCSDYFRSIDNVKPICMDGAPDEGAYSA